MLPACSEISMLTLGSAVWSLAPVLPGGWAVLGEADKIVKSSSRRFASVVSSATGLSVYVLLAVGETIELTVLAGVGTAAQTMLRATCTAHREDAAAEGAVRRVNRFGDVDVPKTVVCTPAGCACN